MRFFPRRLLGSLAWPLLAAVLFSVIRCPKVAGQKPGDAKAAGHDHKTIEIVGDPILKRLRITLDHPRRALFDEKGNLFIVDSGLEKLLKLSADGKVNTLAEKLNEPSGIVRDGRGNIYVSNYADGERNAGTIVRVSPAGKQSTFAKGLTGPKGLALDSDGILYAALFDENRIVKIDKNGKVSDFAGNVGTPAALAFDRKGNLLAVGSAAGIVSRITPKGEVSVIARGLQVPSDIAKGPDGGFIVANYAGTQLTRITADGKTTPYLNVPAGTIGVAFSRDGNLVIVNWNLKLAVKITTRLSIPCPHCKKKIPVRIKPKIKPAKNTKPVI